MRFGLFCSTRDSALSTNRSFKLASLSKEKTLEYASKNLSDFVKILDFCKERDIKMFRLGNSIVPFASHQSFEAQWWSDIAPMFAQARAALEKKPIRLSIHPGQFIQLGSPNEEVVKNSLAELFYCARALDLLGGGEDFVITLHLGGAHGDKAAAIDRFCDVVSKNGWLKKYLALENNEYNFDAKETLDAANRCEIPLIFDIFHHSINPSNIGWDEIKKSWRGKRPKLHISSQAKGGKKGMHADFITKEDFLALREWLGEDVDSVDVMVEAKAKEDAIEALRHIS